MTEMMLDIETLGTNVGCVVLSIGAVAFEKGAMVPLDDMHVVLDQTLQKMMGLKENPSTVEWWKSQSPEAWQSATENPVKVQDALAQLGRFYAKHKPRVTWTQGNNFDPPILEHLYGVLKLPPPWKFWAVRDTRTFYDVHDFDVRKVDRANTYHNARDDCLHQIACMRAASQGV